MALAMWGQRMSETNQLPLADTSDMIRLHRVFREALSSAPRLVGSAPDGDVHRAEHVASYYDNVLRMLHAHHEGEDELLTPKLVDRQPDNADLILRIASQHQDVLAALTAAETAVEMWRSEPSAARRDDAVKALAVLDATLVPHLDEEEREVLPIAARCINVAEWGELATYGMGTFSGDKPWLVLGLIQEQMTLDQIADMEAHMPPPMAEFWATAGRPMFVQYVDELRN